MGQNKDAVWAARRSRAVRAMGGPEFVKRTYAFASWVVLNEENGPACIEQIVKPPKSCPAASTRVIVRWQGRVRAGQRIETSLGKLTVLRFFPMSPRLRVAHLLCCALGDHHVPQL